MQVIADAATGRLTEVDPDVQAVGTVRPFEGG